MFPIDRSRSRTNANEKRREEKREGERSNVPSAGSIMAFLGLGISFEAAGASSDFSKISASSMDDDGSTSAFKNACLAREGALTFLVEEEERVCELILAIDCVVKENIS